MSTQQEAEQGGRRLKGWKAIARHFERDESTVRRWEAGMGLPVHRTPGLGRGAVYAYARDLDEWLTTHRSSEGIGREPAASVSRAAPADGDIAGDTGESIRPKGDGSRKTILVAASAAVVAVCVLAIAAAVLAWLRPAADIVALREYSPQENVRKLYTDGVYLLEKRTRESLPQAVKRLEDAVVIEPKYDRAWAALATAYNLMVEYRLIAADTGYERARIAAENALALNPSLAETQTVLADLEFAWLRDIPASLARFQGAVDLDPTNAQTRHWYASALAFSGEPSRALVEIERARFLDPTSRSIRVSQAIVLLSAGRPADAARHLEALASHEPQYRNPYRFLSFARLALGDDAGYLDALDRWFELTENPVGRGIVAAGRVGLANAGRDGMAAAMLTAALPDMDALEPYFVTHLHALADDVSAAALRLGRITTRHVFYYSIDPAFSAARQDPEFRRALSKMRLPVP